jgi:putative oxidoreductase
MTRGWRRTRGRHAAESHPIAGVLGRLNVAGVLERLNVAGVLERLNVAGVLERRTVRLAPFLVRHSIDALRISLGLIILGFGILKYFPGASPAEPLVMKTTAALTLGLVSGTPAVVGTALLESAIGLALLTGRAMRHALIAMSGWCVGILSPVLLFPGEMFPGGLPTLAAQYVLKDIVVAAAAAVVAAVALGARFVDPAAPAAVAARPSRGDVRAPARAGAGHQVPDDGITRLAD